MPGQRLERTEMATSQAAEFWLTYKPSAGRSIPELLVDRARAAILADTADRARSAGFTRVRVFSTVDIEGLEVERTQPRRLIGSIVSEAAREARGPICYAGSGMPAMMPQDWSAVLETIESGATVANRMFSCDWIGVSEGPMLGSVDRERVDNKFAQLVRDRSGVEVRSYARSARSLLDVDTPADLVVLKTAARVGSLELGPATTTELDSQRELDEQVRVAIKVFETMTRRRKELFICGRVSGSEWALVDRNTSCRVRVLSEERGLRARGQPATSLLAGLYERVGIQQFVSLLSGMGDAMIWDIRPFLSHLGWEGSRPERFEADLGLWMNIEHDGLRELILSLSDSPVLIGGHSLVSGGLLAAIDAAWSRHELTG